MNPRPLPAQYKKTKEWESWPTFDELRAKQPSIKLHKLRALLREVSCYRCPDQSARYVQDEIDELIDDEQIIDEAVKTQTPEGERVSPQLYESMVLFREVMKIAVDLRKMIGELTETAMSPMRLGIELVNTNVDILRRRLEHYEGTHDDTLMLREALMSQSLDRDLRIDKAKGQGELRKQAFGMAMGYLPTLINDLKASAAGNPKAQAALSAIETLEPSVLDAIINEGNLSESQRTAWGRLRDMIKQPPDGNANNKSNGHSPS